MDWLGAMMWTLDGTKFIPMIVLQGGWLLPSGGTRWAQGTNI